MEIILKLFSFFVFLFYVPIKSPCPASHCLRSGPSIRFPFRLSNQTEPGSCGYPGFDLISCGASKETTIHLQSLPFIVREIDYEAQQIRINDPDDCLPGKILSLNFDLPGIPFRADFYKEFSFFSCSSGHRRPELRPIECLSNDTHSVYATSSPPKVRRDLFRACDVVKTVYVPVQSPSIGGDVPPSVLFQDLVLQWDSPNCHHCEEYRGRCGFKGGPGTEIGCFHDEADWLIHVLKVSGVTVFIVGLVLACLASHCASKTARSGPKIEVRETGRQPNPDGPKCPICLSGIRAQEALKTLKPCKHSFHAKCIDKWLLHNATCPVCRRGKQHTTVSLK